MSGQGDGLEQAVDELYGVDLDDFVATRTRLAKRLRDAGQGEDADKLAKLRKPSVGAWVLNQLARRKRREVDLLLDAGHRLREAQAGVLGGGEKEAFDQARKNEADALRQLTREAEKLLQARGSVSGNVLNQVGEALRSAAISRTGRELLARGQFTQPSRAEGFDIVSELAGTPPPAPSRARGTTASAKQAALREARAAVAEAKENLNVARRAEERARRHADSLQKEADTARLEAEHETARREQAAGELEEAERKLRSVS